VKRMYANLCIAVLVLLLCSCSLESPDDAGFMRDISAVDFVKDMGIGVNIGNTLDSIGSNSWTAGETGWGNPQITKGFIKALKKYGYKTIRLPVTWAEHIGPGPDYAIEEAWMNRVAEVVEWILAEDMYCILNIHHDGGEADRSWILGAATNVQGVTKQFATVWNQIAGRFAGASDYLVFEAMNEVGFSSLWDQWNPAKNKKQEAFSIVNSLNQTFVNTVRNSNSNNKSRFLLISGYYTDIDHTCDPLFKMPTDTITDKFLLSIHYYTPATFCIAEELNNGWGFRADWGNEATAESDNEELVRQFNKLTTTFIDDGIPVIIGEYGVTRQNKVEAGRIRWMTAVTQLCLDYGMCPVLWDTGLRNGSDIDRYAPYEMSDSLKSVWENLKIPK